MLGLLPDPPESPVLAGTLVINDIETTAMVGEASVKVRCSADQAPGLVKVKMLLYRAGVV